MKLNGLDWAVIIIYLGMIVSISWSLRKFAQSGLENYFLGGRQLPGWLNGLSYACTCLNADVAPAYCGIAAVTGLYVGWFYISRFGWALLIGGVLFAVFWRRLNIFTAPEFYELRYQGQGAGLMRSWIAFRTSFIAIVAWSGAGLLGLSKIVTPLFGFDKVQTLLIVVPIILAYLYFSGYLGVIMIDAVQALFVLLGNLVLMVAVLIDFGGPTGLASSLVSRFGSEVISSVPPIDNEFLSIFAVLAWTLGTSIGYGGDAAPMGGAVEGQRILSCRNGREAAKMYVWTEVVLFAFLLVLTLPALGAIVVWPGLHTGEMDRELTYGLLLQRYLPNGLLGLLIVSILSSLIGSVSGNLNFGSQVVVNDLYRRWRPDRPEQHYLNIGRFVPVLLLSLAMGVVWGVSYVFDIAVFMLGMSAAELPANWAQWWWWRFNLKARLTASFAGPAIYLLVRLVLFPDLNYAVQILIAMAFSTVLWVAVALLTKPDDEQTLRRFYERARPLGWWGPISGSVRTPVESPAE